MFPVLASTVQVADYTAHGTIRIDGSHVISVRAYDLAGNCNENSVTITVDTTAPTLEITSPMNGSVINIDNVTVTWTANDATTRMDGYEVSLDGADWTLANGTT